MARDWFPSPLGPINFESNRVGLVKIGWGEVVRKNPEDATIETTFTNGKIIQQRADWKDPE